MADEELESFARLNVASEKVVLGLTFPAEASSLTTHKSFFLENLPIKISSEVILENFPLKGVFAGPRC